MRIINIETCSINLNPKIISLTFEFFKMKIFYNYDLTEGKKLEFGAKVKYAKEVMPQGG